MMILMLAQADPPSITLDLAKVVAEFGAAGIVVASILYITPKILGAMRDIQSTFLASSKQEREAFFAELRTIRTENTSALKELERAVDRLAESIRSTK